MNVLLLNELESIDTETGDVNVIVETPSGSRNKFKYEPRINLFKLGKTLPAGAVFPHAFGFIPSTLGQDGDPLDVLVFMDQPTFPGNLVTVRLIGAIEARQSESGKTERNDRLIGVASACQDYRNVKELSDLDLNLVAQLEHFFVSYNEMEGKKFKPSGRPDARHATTLLEEGRKRYDRARQKA